eukprot:3719023-Pyramimonas_sp.AAC.1
MQFGTSCCGSLTLGGHARTRPLHPAIFEGEGGVHYVRELPNEVNPALPLRKRWQGSHLAPYLVAAPSQWPHAAPPTCIMAGRADARSRSPQRHRMEKIGDRLQFVPPAP